MNDKEYTNLDLDTAEALLIAIGRPELAKALTYHAQGVRNLVQGEWGQSFVNTLEGILDRHIGMLTKELGGLRGDTTALQAEFRAGLSGIQSTVSDLAETVDGLQTQMHEGQKDRAQLHQEVAGIKADMALFRSEVASYVSGSRRGELDTLKQEMREMRGEYTPEQWAAILLKMIAEWQAAHPEDDRNSQQGG